MVSHLKIILEFFIGTFEKYLKLNSDLKLWVITQPCGVWTQQELLIEITQLHAKN